MHNLLVTQASPLDFTLKGPICAQHQASHLSSMVFELILFLPNRFQLKNNKGFGEQQQGNGETLANPSWS